MRPIPDYGGGHMTLEEFWKLVDAGRVTNDNGIGYLATAAEMSNIQVRDWLPTYSNFYTHVVWFNK